MGFVGYLEEMRYKCSCSQNFTDLQDDVGKPKGLKLEHEPNDTVRRSSKMSHRLPNNTVSTSQHS